MMKESISSRLKQIMNIKKLKQVDIIEKAKRFEKETGVKISKTDLSQYVNGKTEPGQDKLYVLAKTLNVNEAWLLGYDVPVEPMSDAEKDVVAKQRNIETIAAHIDDDATEEEIEEILAYIEMKRNLRKNRNK